MPTLGGLRECRRKNAAEQRSNIAVDAVMRQRDSCERRVCVGLGVGLICGCGCPPSSYLRVFVCVSGCSPSSYQTNIYTYTSVQLSLIHVTHTPSSPPGLISGLRLLQMRMLHAANCPPVSVCTPQPPQTPIPLLIRCVRR